MNDSRLDPSRFLTTLPRWDQPAFFHAVAQASGALAALRVVPRNEGTRVEGTTADIGAATERCWPEVMRALAAWPGATAQRGGWDLLWMYVPAGEPRALGEQLAAALNPLSEAYLVGRLVVVRVAETGTSAAQEAVRAVEDELERWHHGKGAVELRRANDG